MKLEKFQVLQIYFEEKISITKKLQQSMLCVD